jgi:signal transduction histidine kinase
VRRYVRPVYAFALVLEGANAYGLLLKVEPPLVDIVQLGPITVRHLNVHPTQLGVLLALGAIAAVGTTLALIARATLDGRSDGIVPLIGACCMSASSLHDVLLMFGITRGTWLAPFGNSAFVFSISAAFLIRSSLLSKELTDQSLELTRRSGELRHSYEELREAQRELTRREQLAAVGELAAVIAHEVRNPLAIISNAVAGLRRREIGHEDRETLLAILKEESSRLNRLVGDLLRYARPVNVARQLISIREVIERTLTSSGLRETLPVDLREEGGLHPIWGDPGLLRQVFDNLIENAVQAMGGAEGSSSSKKPPPERALLISIRPRMREEIEGVQIQVQDTGEGMETHVRLRAKDPFFTTRPSGTGLGLAIVDRIVEAHDGEVSIASVPGSGTTVSVFLPIGAPVAPSSGALLVAKDEMRYPRRSSSAR